MSLNNPDQYKVKESQYNILLVSPSTKFQSLRSTIIHYQDVCSHFLIDHSVKFQSHFKNKVEISKFQEVIFVWCPTRNIHKKVWLKKNNK